MSRFFIFYFSIVILFSMLSTHIIRAQEAIGYQEPPDQIRDLADAPGFPALRISPDRNTALFLETPGYPSIEELAEEELRLAGIRINPANFSPSRASYYTGIQIRAIHNKAVAKSIEGLPTDIRISSPVFNKSGSRFAFVLVHKDEVELWWVDVQTARAQKLTGHINATLGGTFTWLDDDHLVAKQIFFGHEHKPVASKMAPVPSIQSNDGSAAPVRTYQDLLRNAGDESMFEYYTTSRLIKYTLPTGTSESLGIEGIVSGMSVSPNGEYLMVNRMHRPFSYLVPYYRFPNTTEVFDSKGRLIEAVASIPPTESLPKGFNAVPEGRRNIGWRNDAPATLYWVEAQDGGDPAKQAEIRDILYLKVVGNEKIFQGPAMKLRYAGIQWGNENLAIIQERWWSTRQQITTAWSPGNPSAAGRELFNRSYEDRYADPGSFLTLPNAWGQQTLCLLNRGKTLILTGMGASPEGNRPFIDEYELASGKTRRLWRSEAPYFEMPALAFDPAKGLWLTRRESTDQPPDYFMRNLRKNTLEAFTDFENPYKALAGIQREIVGYERADGLKLTGTLYLPAGYDKAKDGPLPVFMWAYPREFKSADAAGQMNRSPYEFTRISWGSPLFWVTQGYAIFDDFSMPIVGEGDDEPNESFVEQLRLSAESAINTLVDMGVADRNRIAVGGHSYGAFMTANLLAHTNLFAAGIARSGAYNRSLTPFGFQAEQRTYWEAGDVYHKMSPFNYAHEIKTPLLLIHGEADNNSGTFPMQSERFYAALKGHGTTTRLVMLPYESHGYRARESVMHTLWEMHEWLEKYVKNRGNL
ncbi:MAG: S9 family peptidase [Cyclobacteriaceae bacterium]|nr:S9 family peptidase [Cyclobacteriaceae bacterium]